MLKNEMICISCPIGCRIRVWCQSDQVTIEGNQCNRGEQYAREEISDPRRIVTAVVATDDVNLKYVPVKTDKPIPKKHIEALLVEIYGKKISLPVKIGDQILRDFQGTGVNVVATRNGCSTSKALNGR